MYSQFNCRSLTPLAAAISLALSTMSVQASTSGVVISQVYGGNGSTFASDYVEIFNASATTQNITGWSVQYSSASGTGLFSGNGVTVLNGTLQPGQYYLVKLSTSATGTALPAADASGTTNVSSASGKVVLVNASAGLACNGGSTACNATQAAQIVDLVGFGSSNYFEGTAAPTLTATTALLRAGNGCTDTDVNSADFAAGTPVPRNTASALNVCSGSGGGGTGGGTGGGSGGGTGSGTTTPIYQIQGSGATSPLVGSTVNTQGVVTKVNNNGFFLQDPIGDGNAATSDGIFVFTSTVPTVVAGQAITLTGTVAEFDVSGASSNPQAEAHTVTELTSPTNITVLSSGNVILPTNITLPVASDAELEALEGMLVKINTQLTASQNYFLGRYGQITLSAGGRLVKPTNAFRPGTADALSMAASNALRTIILDDGTAAQNPINTPYIGQDNTNRAGDTIDSITGVIDYGLITASATGLANYKIHPTEAVTFTRAHPRTNAPANVGGNVKVASFNVLNYFTTFTNGATASGQTGQGCSLGSSVSTANCRGADNMDEFLRQRTKIVKALAALNADVVGLMEIQNIGNTAVQNLVDALNTEVGAGTYATVGLPSAGTGTDAIRVAMIYKPASLTPSGAAQSDTDAINNRPPLAQTFSAANGEKFTLVVNHFKSKGSCPTASDADYAGNFDAGDGQGCWSGRRVDQANRLGTFISTLQANAADNDVLVIGDLNAYGKEDPVYTLTSNGLTNLGETFNGTSDYSYVFDGELGALDHALASASALSQVTGTVHWHINADEPSIIDYERDFKRPTAASSCYVTTQTSCSVDLYSATPFRSSDHDPVLIGLNLVKVINGTSGRDTIVGTAGDDVITGGDLSDTITGGAGRDVFVYTSMRDGLDTITDFTPGVDRLDLTALLASIQVSPANAIAGGYVKLVNTASGTQVQVDADGVGAGLPRAIVLLKGVAANQIDIARDLGL